MKIIKNDIRPIGFITIEMQENEVQAIVSMVEELCYIHNRPFDKIGGTREYLYKTLKDSISVKK